jgi:hypothetical protein
MGDNMYTLCIGYTLDLNRAVHFRIYVENELAAIRRSGGKIIWLLSPNGFRGPDQRRLRADRVSDASEFHSPTMPVINTTPLNLSVAEPSSA